MARNENGGSGRPSDWPDEAYGLIGRYIFWFSRLDDAVRIVAADLVGLTDKQRDSLLAVVDFASVCNVCKAQIKEKLSDDSERDLALKLIDRALGANDDRVRVAHGYWLFSEGQAVAVHTSRRTLRQEPHFAKPGELLKRIDELRGLTLLIWDKLIVASLSLRAPVR
jgi:hypothetical protein